MSIDCFDFFLNLTLFLQSNNNAGQLVQSRGISSLESTVDSQKAGIREKTKNAQNSNTVDGNKKNESGKKWSY